MTCPAQNSEGTPRYESDVVTFQFSLDLVGDFDASGFLDSPDIDQLSERVLSGEYAAEFDLNADELLSADDRAIWIEELVGTQLGDADLNGSVEFADFLRLANAFPTEAGWSSGDFDGDGFVRFPDFLALSQNFGVEGGGVVVPIPEPQLSAMILGLLPFGLRRRAKDCDVN